MSRFDTASHRRATSVAFAAWLLAGPALASDWPQWGGADRDFTLEGAALAEAWPASGPEVLWRRPLGEGYSSFALAGGRLFTLYRLGGDEVVVALDPDTGRTLWQHRWPEPTDGFNLQHGPGPHSTPLVVGERVFAVGARGRLVALDAATGSQLWSRELIEGLGGTFDVVYFSNGDFGPVPLTAADVTSGEILWRDRHFARASLIRAGDVLVLLDEDGTLALVRVDREGLEVLAEHQLLDRRAWTPPALSGRTLYVRDREEIQAVRLPGQE